MSSRRVTSSDVARAAGLSRAAVSLVLNGRAEGMVEAEKQERVRRIARELGYVPNASAVNLRRQSTATIGLITDEIASAAFAGPLITGASEVAMQGGYMVLTIDTTHHEAYVEGAVDTLRARDVDGLIYAAASVHEVDLPQNARRLPIVLSNAFVGDGSIPGYIPDDRSGGRVAAQLAIDAGHRSICFVTGDPDAFATEERVAGFREAMDAAGLAVDERSLVTARYSVHSNYDAALEILRRPDRPTVLLCANDRGAAGAILAASSLGLSVPGDLSVVGFDDEKFFAADVPPALTTVALPHREMGAEAATHLLRLITGEPEVDTGGTVRLDCVPVVRESLAPPPAVVRPSRA